MEVKPGSSSRRLTEMRARARAVDDLLHFQSFSIPAHKLREEAAERVPEHADGDCMWWAPPPTTTFKRAVNVSLPSGAWPPNRQQNSSALPKTKAALLLMSSPPSFRLPLLTCPAPAIRFFQLGRNHLKAGAVKPNEQKELVMPASSLTTSLIEILIVLGFLFFQLKWFSKKLFVLLC